MYSIFNRIYSEIVKKSLGLVSHINKPEYNKIQLNDK